MLFTTFLVPRYDQFCRGVTDEFQLRQQIGELQEYRANGITDLALVGVYNAMRVRRSMERNRRGLFTDALSKHEVPASVHTLSGSLCGQAESTCWQAESTCWQAESTCWQAESTCWQAESTCWQAESTCWQYKSLYLLSIWVSLYWEFDSLSVDSLSLCVDSLSLSVHRWNQRVTVSSCCATHLTGGDCPTPVRNFSGAHYKTGCLYIYRSVDAWRPLGVATDVPVCCCSPKERAAPQHRQYARLREAAGRGETGNGPSPSDISAARTSCN